MSTEASSRRTQSRKRRGRAFTTAFAAVAGALAVVALGTATLTTVAGPRVTEVQFDPVSSTAAAGSRLIVTTTQSLAEVTPEQVTVTPAADVTVDTSGRSVGIRFARPLWDDTEYRVQIDDVQPVGGGPGITIDETVQTAPLELFVLQRSVSGDDTIFRTDLVGDAAVPVATYPHIEDFRGAARHVIVSTLTDDGVSELFITDLDGAGERRVALPGAGIVTNLQSSDTGDEIGFTYTDADLSAEGGLESRLYTLSLRDDDAELERVDVQGAESRVGDWRFVPGTGAVLLLTFDGRLTLVGEAGDPVALGDALEIGGIPRGSTNAVVLRADEIVQIDLATAEESPLAPTDPELGALGPVTAATHEHTLRVLTRMEGVDVVSSAVALVDEAGAAQTVFSIDPADALMQTCVSPNGRYAAFVVAPNIIDNAFDAYLLPLPQQLQTHVVELATAQEVVALSGFDVSWCQSPPRS